MEQYAPSGIGSPGNLIAVQVTILSGASATEMVPTQGMALVAIIMPGTWTAAAIAFKGCISGNVADLQFLYNNTGQTEQTLAAASETILFPIPDASFLSWIQLVSVQTTTTTPVTQGGDRKLTLLFRKYLS